MRDTIKSPVVVAEACCNHMGDFQIAKDMISTAATFCKVDYVKFQKRCPEESVPKYIQDKPHPCPSNAFGETYLEHRKSLEFTIDQHAELQNICTNLGTNYSCSVWDITSAKDIISLNPPFIKVPSAANIYFDMLDILYGEYQGDVHISLGMITRPERESIEKYILNNQLENRTVLYWTTSGYPVQFEELYLLEIKELCKVFPMVGFSGHNLGIAVDVAAYTLGANWLERHFTLDRTWKGTDQAASLEPIGLQKVARDLRAVYKSLTHKDVEMTKDEKDNRSKLKITKGGLQ